MVTDSYTDFHAPKIWLKQYSPVCVYPCQKGTASHKTWSFCEKWSRCYWHKSIIIMAVKIHITVPWTHVSHRHMCKKAELCKQSCLSFMVIHNNCSWMPTPPILPVTMIHDCIGLFDTVNKPKTAACSICHGQTHT